MSLSILCIETSTVPFSVAIARGRETVAMVENDVRTSLASSITVMIMECCSKAAIDLQQIDAIAVNEGPGSYTGLRIGLSVAKGLSFALNKPLILLSGLEGLAYHSIETVNGIDDRTLICSALDARRDEVYLEVYDHMGAQVLGATACILPTSLTLMTGREDVTQVVAAGDGGPKLISKLGAFNYIESNSRSRADYLIPLALRKYENSDFSNVETSEPFYLKPPNITTPKAR